MKSPNDRGRVLDLLLTGNGLGTLDVVDCHAHMGPANYMLVPDGDADGLVRTLDHLGVATVCVSHSLGMVSDWKIGNDLLIEAVLRYPQRIFGYTFYNPRYPAAMAGELDRCSAAGLRGIKIHPDFHRTAASDRAYNLAYERAQDEGRPILCHYDARNGQRSGAGLYKQVVDRFPRARYVMAHSLPDRQAVDTAVECFGSRPEVSFCLANAYQPGVLSYACQRLGVERLLYGSDGCWSSMAGRLGLISASTLSDEEKIQILGRNMRRLLE